MTDLQSMLYQAMITNLHVKGTGYTVEQCLQVAKKAFDTDLPKVEKAIARLIKLDKIEMHFSEDEVILRAKV